MGGRSGGTKLHISIGVRDFHAVLEIRKRNVFLTGRDFDGAVDTVQLERSDLHTEPAGELLGCHLGARGFKV